MAIESLYDDHAGIARILIAAYDLWEVDCSIQISANLNDTLNVVEQMKKQGFTTRPSNTGHLLVFRPDTDVRWIEIRAETNNEDDLDEYVIQIGSM